MRNSIAVGIVVIALGGCMDESPPIVLHPVDGIRGELVEGTVQIAYESAQHDGVLTSEINEIGRAHV
jgi:hypothetical protein